MTPDWDSDREELLRLARRRDCRFTEFSPSIPCDWAPLTVWDPRFEMFFSDQSAWLLIVELLESGRAFTPKAMKKPAGTVAYETTTSLAPNLPELYIKVQIHKGRILGRSFHNVTK